MIYRQDDFESYLRRERDRFGADDAPLSERDLEELDAGSRRVYQLMKDGDWHTPREIRLAAGGGSAEASEGLRRLRALRELFEVEKKRPDGFRRQWVYRLRPRGEQWRR